MKNLTYLTLVLTVAFAGSIAHAQDADPAGLVIGIPNISSPIQPIGTLTNHNGGPVFARGTRTALLLQRADLKRFFDSGGHAVSGQLPINWSQQRGETQPVNHFTTINWERHMALAVANCQGGDEVKFTKVVRRSTESGRLIEYVGVYKTRKNARANAAGSSPFSLVVLPRETATGNIPTRIITEAQYERERREQILSMTKPNDYDGLPLPTQQEEQPTQQEEPPTQAEEAPSQYEEPPTVSQPPPLFGIDFERHAKGNVGPNTNRGMLANWLNPYLQFFGTEGQQVGARQVAWDKGDVAVLVGSGEADAQGNRKGMKITQIALDARQDLLLVTVERSDLPRHLSHVYRPWESVTFNKSELHGREVNSVRVIDTDGTVLGNYDASGEEISNPTPTTPDNGETSIDFTRHAQGNVGPNVNRGFLADWLNPYKQFFGTEGQQVGARQVAWDKGDVAVLVANGKANAKGNRKTMKITKVTLPVRGSMLLVTVERNALPRHMSHVNRPWEAVTFNKSQLQGRTINTVRVLNTDGKILGSYNRKGERIPDVRGMSGLLGGTR